MKTVKVYYNDSDFVIRIIEKNNMYYVVLFDTCNVLKPSQIACCKDLNDAKKIASAENEQYNFI